MKISNKGHMTGHLLALEMDCWPDFIHALDNYVEIVSLLVKLNTCCSTRESSFHVIIQERFQSVIGPTSNCCSKVDLTIN